MLYRPIKTVLSIAGSDCSGGAGIQADIKSIISNGCYAMTAITALTAQNTTGVYGTYVCDSEFLKKQLDAIADDIAIDAVKIGMISSLSNIDVISDFIINNNISNIVVDPVMVATSGSKLIEDDAIDALKNKLFPKATVITPNIPEAELLSGTKIHNKEDMEKVAVRLSREYNCAVLLKGGHSINDANDILAVASGITWYKANRIENENTHGTGCTLSSAIASNLAKGYEITQSIKNAKLYIENTLRYGINLGKASGPLNHGYNTDGDYMHDLNIKDKLKLYAVTDNSWLNGRKLSVDVEQAILGGATFIQLRDKDKSYEELLVEAKELRVLTRKYNVPFVINDNVELAVLCDADGVHLGQDDMSIEEARKILGHNKIIGATAHNLDEAMLAIKAGANYLGVGAVFGSTTKANTTDLSLEELKRICKYATVPVVAIGGINYDNLDVLKDTGITGVAVVSAIFAKEDIQHAASKLRTKLEEEIIND